jgi:hypothetical protein
MRYCYHNLAYIKSGARYGIFCDPVKRDGKCVRGRGNQLVIFEDGTIAAVVARTLRLKNKCKIHEV